MGFREYKAPPKRNKYALHSATPLVQSEEKPSEFSVPVKPRIAPTLTEIEKRKLLKRHRIKTLTPERIECALLIKKYLDDGQSRNWIVAAITAAHRGEKGFGETMVLRDYAALNPSPIATQKKRKMGG